MVFKSLRCWSLDDNFSFHYDVEQLTGVAILEDCLSAPELCVPHVAHQVLVGFLIVQLCLLLEKSVVFEKLGYVLDVLHRAVLRVQLQNPFYFLARVRNSASGVAHHAVPAARGERALTSDWGVLNLRAAMADVVLDGEFLRYHCLASSRITFQNAQRRRGLLHFMK